MLVGVGLDEARIDSKAFTANEAGRDAGPDDTNETAWASNSSMSLKKRQQSGSAGRPCEYHHDVDAEIGGRADERGAAKDRRIPASSARNLPICRNVILSVKFSALRK